MQILEPGTPALRRACPQRWPDERFEQAGLSVRCGAKRAQVARGDPVARERLAGLRDVRVGLRVEPLAALDPRLQEAEVLELPRSRRLDPGALAERLEVESFLGLPE